MILNLKKQTDVKLGSGRECGFGLSFVEAAGYECLRRNAGLEVWVRFSITIWDIISVRLATVDASEQKDGDLINITVRNYSAMSDSSRVMVL